MIESTHVGNSVRFRSEQAPGFLQPNSLEPRPINKSDLETHDNIACSRRILLSRRYTTAA